MRIDGHCALITGAGSGLGRATAEWLHAAGAEVVLTDQNPDGLDQVVRALGQRVATLRVDVCDPEQIESALCYAEERFGSVRMTVNCAGIASSAKTISDGRNHDWALWRRVIDVNLSGTFYATCLAAAHMARNVQDDVR